MKLSEIQTRIDHHTKEFEQSIKTVAHQVFTLHVKPTLIKNRWSFNPCVDIWDFYSIEDENGQQVHNSHADLRPIQEFLHIPVDQVSLFHYMPDFTPDEKLGLL